VGVRHDVIDTICGKKRGPSLHANDMVSLAKEQLSKV